MNPMQAKLDAIRREAARRMALATLKPVAHLRNIGTPGALLAGLDLLRETRAGQAPWVARAIADIRAETLGRDVEEAETPARPTDDEIITEARETNANGLLEHAIEACEKARAAWADDNREALAHWLGVAALAPYPFCIEVERCRSEYTRGSRQLFEHDLAKLGRTW